MTRHSEPSAPDILARVGRSACVHAAWLLLLGFGLPGWAASAEPDVGQTGAAAVPMRPERHTPTRATPVPPKAHVPSAGPNWKSLDAEQKQALLPLKSTWRRLGPQSKQKWLEVSKNFSSLSDEEQARLHSRMSEWAGMSRKQREQARMNYARTQDMSAEEKLSQWRAYQRLSPEQKRKLATRSPAKPAGAAIVSPSSPNKLQPIPPAKRPKKPSRAAGSQAPPAQATTAPAPAHD